MSRIVLFLLWLGMAAPAFAADNPMHGLRAYAFRGADTASYLGNPAYVAMLKSAMKQPSMEVDGDNQGAAKSAVLAKFAEADVFWGISVRREMQPCV